MDAVIQLAVASEPFYYSLVFIVSLMVGSFLNVVIHRLPIMMENSWKQEYQNYFNPDEPSTSPSTYNLVKPDSTCPSCGHKIKPWENIPVVSWLFLRGKCSHCHTPISTRYPTVELVTALLSLAIAAYFGPTQQGIIGILVTYILVALTCIDLDKMLLPDQLTLPLLWLGLLVSTQHLFVSPVEAILGVIFGYLSLWSVYWLFKLITGKEGMGYGDFKLLAALGAFVGWSGIPIIIVLSSMVGAIIGIGLMAKRSDNNDIAIPFGPYLATAGWLTLMFKADMISAYLTWMGL